jgi:tetratricopeptide (TPR) repeat protein
VAAIVAVAVVSTFAASWAFDRASEAAAVGGRSAAVANLRLAVAFDPSHPLYHRELGSWIGSEDSNEAIDQLRTAVALNPDDTQALRALALLDASVGDEEEATDLTSRLVDDYDTRIESALTAGYVASVFHDEEGLHSALVSAVRRVPWITASPDFLLVFPDANPTELLQDAYASWQDPNEFTTSNLAARVWIAGMLDLPPAEGTPVGLQLQNAVLRCQMRVAEDLDNDMIGAIRAEYESILGLVMFENAFGSAGVDEEVMLNFQRRSPGLARLLGEPEGGPGPVPDAFQDVTFYDRIPLSPISVMPLPSSASGLKAWLRDPVTAASAGAPDSPIAGCTDTSASP